MKDTRIFRESDPETGIEYDVTYKEVSREEVTTLTQTKNILIQYVDTKKVEEVMRELQSAGVIIE